MRVRNWVKVATSFFGLLFFTSSLLLLLPQTGHADAAIDLKLDIKNVPQTVIVGQKGKFDYQIRSVDEGIPTSGSVKFISENKDIFKLDNNGNWEALKPGKTQFYYTIHLSNETDKALMDKYGNYYVHDNQDYFPVTILPNVESVYRLYNPHSGEHFYTKASTERDSLVKLGWKVEGKSWNSHTNGTPVYRIYNPNAGDHHYTTSQQELALLVDHGWRDEGVSFYSSNVKKQAIYRLYNPNAKAGAHHYTKDVNEKNNLAKIGWQSEGVSWYDD